MYYTITTFPCHMAIVKPTTAVMISFVVYESTFLHISATHMTKVFVKGTMSFLLCGDGGGSVVCDLV